MILHEAPRLAPIEHRRRPGQSEVATGVIIMAVGFLLKGLAVLALTAATGISGVPLGEYP